MPGLAAVAVQQGGYVADHILNRIHGRSSDSFRYVDKGMLVEVWRRGSVIASWLLDLTANALLKQPELATFSGRVADSGEGRWTITAAIDEGTPAPVLSAALYERFASRGEDDFVLAAMRLEFGGHVQRPTGG